jgi:mycothiol system anti-sigma-R factor
MKEDCRSYFLKISEYLDGEVDEKTCDKIETHLRQCPECLDCFESLEKTIQLCKNGSSEALPADVRKRLRATLREFLNQSNA